MLSVLRLCSVFEPPDVALDGRGRRFVPIGGMQNHTASLVRALDRRGVRQRVVTTRPPGAPRVERRGEHAVVRRVGLPVPWMRQGYAAPAAVDARRSAREVDLVHAHLGEDLAMAPLARAAARAAGVPLVLTVHTSLRHTFVEGGATRAAAGTRGWALARLGGPIERAAVRAADAVITLTPRLAERLATDGVDPARLRVIPSGVERAAFAVDASSGDPLAGIARPRVLFVGRLARQKGVTTLVEAAARLRTPGAQVVLVGDGPQRAEVEALTARLGLADRITLTGFRPHGEIPSILRAADLLVMPSVYEELGSALVEGLEAGLPIVASRVGGIPDAVGDAAVLVPPCDPAALAAAIDELLADDARRARLAAAAREQARRYDWDDLADEVLALYRDLVDGALPDEQLVPAAVATP